MCGFFSSAKYCSLIDKEGGLQLLEELINGNLRPAPYPEILKLAGIVRQNVAKWRNSQVLAVVELLPVGVFVASLGRYEKIIKITPLCQQHNTWAEFSTLERKLLN